MKRWANVRPRDIYIYIQLYILLYITIPSESKLNHATITNHRENSSHVLIHGSWARTTILSRTLSEMSRLVVISDLGFSCKLRVKELHLLDIFLYRSTRRIWVCLKMLG